MGYLVGKASSKLLKTDLNIPLVFALSVVSDADILIRGLEHRGPAHSIITALLIFIPLLAVYRRKAVPYLLALVSHSLIGDILTGGNIQLLWPISLQKYGFALSIRSPLSMASEWVLFLTSTVVIIRTKDIAKLIQLRYSNLILVLPMSTVLLPVFSGFPMDVPTWLILPHMSYLSLFMVSILSTVLKITRSMLAERRQTSIAHVNSTLSP